MKTLIVVESPTKAKTISQFLDDSYQVASSYGHVRDLPEKRLGIDTAQNFQPEYVIPPKAKIVLGKLRGEVRKNKTVILATDEDREGEAIAWHLAQALKLKQPQRIVFHEITKGAIEEALRQPRSLDMNLVNAQQARRILDRIVGYQISPFLWKKVATGLSAGRVQSVALRLIVERENEIRNFKSQEYWTIAAHLSKISTPPEFEALLVKIDTKVLEKFDIKTREEAEEIAANLEKARYHVLKIERKEMRRNPPPPFTTSTLQQEAANRLGFTAKKTMFLAQRLYEEGSITYMRTDSVHLAPPALTAAKRWLEAQLGATYAAQAPRRFSTKSKLAQEAHEAIRPTHVERVPETFGGEANAQELYELIWRRFMASQMPQAKISTTMVEILANNQQSTINYQLRATGQQIVFDGYLKIWPQKISENELPPLTDNETLQLNQVKPEQHFTEPPPRYSEATLIKTLEQNGIGRPSTYAPTIAVIQERDYVIKNAGRFQPEPIGELVNKVLTENFPEIVDINFTAALEDELDAVARGKTQWQTLLNSFYGPFSKNLEEKYVTVGRQKLAAEPTDEICPQCGKQLVVRVSRYGKFLACSGFPQCRFIKKPEKTGGAGATTGIKCPQCAEGELVERLARKGRRRKFWGCSRYPKCTYVTGKKPES